MADAEHSLAVDAQYRDAIAYQETLTELSRLKSRRMFCTICGLLIALCVYSFLNGNIDIAPMNEELGTGTLILWKGIVYVMTAWCFFIPFGMVLVCEHLFSNIGCLVGPLALFVLLFVFIILLAAIIGPVYAIYLSVEIHSLNEDVKAATQ